MLLLITAPFSYWSDETWGVRKLVPIIPLLHLPLIFIFNKLKFNKIKVFGIAVLLILSMYIQIIGASYSYGRQLEILNRSNLDSLYHMRFTPQLSHVPLYHNLFVGFLSKSDSYLLFQEQTWFRWIRKDPDIFLNDVKLNLSEFTNPNIVWLNRLSAGKIFIFVFLVGFDILSLIALGYLCVKLKNKSI